jgi:hypothetical protein
MEKTPFFDVTDLSDKNCSPKKSTLLTNMDLNKNINSPGCERHFDQIG